MSLNGFTDHGTASVIVGGQWGSEGKGAAAAYLAKSVILAGRAAGRPRFFNIVTTNAGAQAGHTSIHDGRKRVVYHLPTAPLVARDMNVETPPVIYLNAGSIIDPGVLTQEMQDHDIDPSRFFIHPNAAVITDDCREAEMRSDSAQTRIASTRKGVGEAFARKALRSGMIARDCPELKIYTRRLNLNDVLQRGGSVLVEVPQGFSLSVNGKFWPYCTSRDCTLQSGLSDAGIHPSFLGQSMMVLRTFPIRVGHIPDPTAPDDAIGPGALLGNSGGCYHDQRELKWEDVGVPPEITTVTKRVRRVFTFSRSQLLDAMAAMRPTAVYLGFCDYVRPSHGGTLIAMIEDAARIVGMQQAPDIYLAWGPSTDDVCHVGEKEKVQWKK